MTDALQDAYDKSAVVISRSFEFARWKFVNAAATPPAPFGDKGQPLIDALLRFEPAPSKNEARRDLWLYVFRDGGNDYSEIKDEIRLDSQGEMFATIGDVASELKSRKRLPEKGFGKLLCLPRRVFGAPLVYRVYSSRVRLPLPQLKTLRNKIQKFAPPVNLEPGDNTSIVLKDDRLFVPAVDPITIALHLHAAFEAAANDVIDYTVPHDGLDQKTRSRVANRRKKHLLSVLMRGLIGEPPHGDRANLIPGLVDGELPLERYLVHYQAQVEHRARLRDSLARKLVRWLASDAMKVAASAHRAAGQTEWERYLFAWCRAHRRLSETEAGRDYIAGVLKDKAHFAHTTVWPSGKLDADQVQAIRKLGMTLVEAYKEFAQVRIVVLGGDALKDTSKTLSTLQGLKPDELEWKKPKKPVVGLSAPVEIPELSLTQKTGKSLIPGSFGVLIESINFALNVSSTSKALSDANVSSEDRSAALIGLVGSAMDAGSATGSLLKARGMTVPALGYVSGVIDVYLGIKAVGDARRAGNYGGARGALISTVGSSIGAVGSLMGLLAFPGAGVIGVLALAVVSIGLLYKLIADKSPLQLFFIHSTWGHRRGGDAHPDWSRTKFSDWRKEYKGGLDHQLEALLNLLCTIKIGRGADLRQIPVSVSFLPPGAVLTVQYKETWSNTTFAPLEGSIEFTPKGPVARDATFTVTPSGKSSVTLVVAKSGLPALHEQVDGMKQLASALKGVEIKAKLTLTFPHAPTVEVPLKGWHVHKVVPTRPTVWKGTMQETSFGAAPMSQTLSGAQRLEYETPFLSSEVLSSETVGSEVSAAEVVASTEVETELALQSAVESTFEAAEAEWAASEAAAPETSESEAAEPQAPAFELESPFEQVEGLPKIPSVVELRASVKKIKFNAKSGAAAALDKALAAIAKPLEFPAALTAGLHAAPNVGEPGNGALQVVFARLGAEAFVRNIRMPEANRALIGFAQHPSELGEGLQPGHVRWFVYFACEGLRRAKLSTPTQHEQHLELAVQLFAWVQARIKRRDALGGLSDEQLQKHRRLLAALICKHYQALLEAALAAVQAGKLNADDALKAMRRHLQRAAILDLSDEDALLPMFRIVGKTYRDYFEPLSKTDIGFAYYSARARKVDKVEVQTPYRAVLRRRGEQLDLLASLQTSAARSWPDFDDGAAFAIWLQAYWGALRAQLAFERTEKVLRLVERCFRQFTTHVPQDLKEGCKEQNYLTRTFPRAVTGSKLHDCAVYATRWLHLLSGIFDPSKPGAQITKPRALLVEMPAHVGVLIRFNPGAGTGLAISINNQAAKLLSGTDAGGTDIEVAKLVARDMYPNLKTPIRIKAITAPLSHPAQLWQQVCRIFDTKSGLPFTSPDEPHLAYVGYKAMAARNLTQLRDNVIVRWLELNESLQVKKTMDERKQALRTYAERVKAHIAESETFHKERVMEFATEVDGLLQKGASALKGVTIAEPAHANPSWFSELVGYVNAIHRGLATGDVSGLDPRNFIPEDDFVAPIP